MLVALRWGILGAAGIARKAFIPAIQKSKLNRLVGIASRDRNKAQSFCDELGLDCEIFDSYEALIASEQIDAIYNPTPNHLHVELTQAAVRAGKHVLCEKPIGLDQHQAQSLIQFCSEHPRIRVMEAFMYRFHPQWLQAKKLVDSGEIGELKHIHTHFCYFNSDPDNVRNRADIGGGALLDVGCYAVSLARWLFGAQPKKVTSSIERDPKFKTDVHTRGMMEFERGVSTFYCSTMSATGQSVEISGTLGKIILPVPFNPDPAEVAAIKLLKPKSDVIYQFKQANHYVEQIDAFAQSVTNATPVPTPLEDALENMQVIDALFESAKQGLAIAFD